MKVDKKGIEFLRKHEGVELKVYDDSAGYPTIGVGHKLLDSELATDKIKINGVFVDYTKGLTLQQVDDLLAQDIAPRAAKVDELVKVKVTQNQFNALVSLAFNIGIGAFKDSTLLRHLNASQYAEVPAQFKRWKRARGQVLQGLINRRAAEVELWYTNSESESDWVKEFKFVGDRYATISMHEAPDGQKTIIFNGDWKKQKR